jgi:NAD+ kinase
MSAASRNGRGNGKSANGKSANGPRVLVVYKKSAYQTNVRERKNPRFVELLARKHPSVARLVEAHEDHQATLEEAHEALDRLGVRATFRFRGDEGLVEDVDLVVTIGGDGTLLWAARWVGPGVPVIAINSAPHDSVGHFCAGKKGHVRSLVARALDGSLRRTELTRMQVALDGEIVTRRVLNDMLFAHPSPAATTRYMLSVEPRRGRARVEEQKSSGVWVGPAAGSTAAQLSAGGKVLPVASKKLQFVVREPYQPRGRRITMARGLVPDGGRLRIISKIREGRLFIDGPHRMRDVRMGSEIVLSRSSEPLLLLGMPRAARR